MSRRPTRYHYNAEGKYKGCSSDTSPIVGLIGMIAIGFIVLCLICSGICQMLSDIPWWGWVLGVVGIIVVVVVGASVSSSIKDDELKAQRKAAVSAAKKLEQERLDAAQKLEQIRLDQVKKLENKCLDHALVCRCSSPALPVYALPICGTKNCYRCDKCGNQFAGARHGL